MWLGHAGLFCSAWSSKSRGFQVSSSACPLASASHHKEKCLFAPVPFQYGWGSQVWPARPLAFKRANQAALSFDCVPGLRVREGSYWGEVASCYAWKEPFPVLYWVHWWTLQIGDVSSYFWAPGHVGNLSLTFIECFIIPVRWKGFGFYMQCLLCDLGLSCCYASGNSAPTCARRWWSTWSAGNSQIHQGELHALQLPWNVHVWDAQCLVFTAYCCRFHCCKMFTTEKNQYIAAKFIVFDLEIRSIAVFSGN